jgi:predicted nucleic acid-binding protein
MERSGVGMLSLHAPEIDALIGATAKFNLDFYDAYQCSAAMKHGLMIVSFDADFDRTTEGRLLPTDAL